MGTRRGEESRQKLVKMFFPHEKPERERAEGKMFSYVHRRFTAKAEKPRNEHIWPIINFKQELKLHNHQLYFYSFM